MRRNPDSIQMMKQLAASVPRVAREMNLLDLVSTERRLYQADADIPPEWAETPNGHVASVDLTSTVLVSCSHTEGWSR